MTTCPRSLIRAGQAVLRPVACDLVPGAGGKGQGAEMLREAWRLALPPSAACVSQPLRLAGCTGTMGGRVGLITARLAFCRFPRPSLRLLVPEHLSGLATPPFFRRWQVWRFFAPRGAAPPFGAAHKRRSQARPSLGALRILFDVMRFRSCAS